MNSIKYSAGFEIGRPVEQVFPLFTPEGEKLWTPGWDYEDVRGASEPAEDAVFLTHGHDHAAAQAIWLVKRYEPQNYYVQYYKVEPGDKVGIVTVQCAGQTPDETHVEVTYEYVALSQKGRAFIESFTRESYETFIAKWAELLGSYFTAAG